MWDWGLNLEYSVIVVDKKIMPCSIKLHDGKSVVTLQRLHFMVLENLLFICIPKWGMKDWILPSCPSSGSTIAGKDECTPPPPCPPPHPSKKNLVLPLCSSSKKKIFTKLSYQGHLQNQSMIQSSPHPSKHDALHLHIIPKSNRKSNPKAVWNR